MMKSFYLVIIGLSLTAALFAEPVVNPLWPDGIPMRTPEQTAQEPMMTIYLPDENINTGAAVVIFPGGGYWNLAMDHEGHQIAQWLNSFGVAGIIVEYRRGTGSQHPVPLMDAQRAIRTVKYNAEKWNINPDRVGVIGFSAGGHLASTTGTHFDNGMADSADPIDQTSCRPDFMILIYPVISLNTEYTHQGSKTNLLGENPDPKLVDLFSNNLQITSETPPTFLIHTSEDNAVPAENSVLFYMGLRKAGVPAEMHIFEKGPHGFGLAPNNFVLAKWPQLCKNWFDTRGLLEK